MRISHLAISEIMPKLFSDKQRYCRYIQKYIKTVQYRGTKDISGGKSDRLKPQAERKEVVYGPFKSFEVQAIITNNDLIALLLTHHSA